MPIPKLTPDQIAQVTGLVSQVHLHSAKELRTPSSPVVCTAEGYNERIFLAALMNLSVQRPSELSSRITTGTISTNGTRIQAASSV